MLTSYQIHKSININIISYVNNSSNQKLTIWMNLITTLWIREYPFKELRWFFTKYLLIIRDVKLFLSGKYLRFLSSITSFDKRFTLRTKLLWLHPLNEEQRQEETAESYAKVNFLFYTKKNIYFSLSSIINDSFVSSMLAHNIQKILLS